MSYNSSITENEVIIMIKYPLKLRPVCKDIIWGGDKLRADYGKVSDSPRIAESWELTVRPDGMSVIENGCYAGMSLAEYLNTLKPFPLLIKLIDAHDKLSIQVHPSDDYALKNEGEFGKTEMWYIVEAEPDAEIVYGLEGEFSKEIYDKAVAEGKIESLLHRVKVKAGDVYFIPSGLVHAIGKGILICEIQQNSNITYRVYDYNRPGKDGKPRELHVEKARDVIVNYSPEQIETLRYSGNADLTPDLLATCDKFTVHKYEFSELELTVTDFISATFVDGSGYIEYEGERYDFRKGDTYYLPAGLGSVKLMAEKAVCILASSKA